MHRQCRICGQWKPVEIFGEGIGNTKIARWCPPCHNEWTYQYNKSPQHAKDFVADEQSQWDYVANRPPEDKEV